MSARNVIRVGLPRRLATFGLALWIGGVGCLFGCEMTVSAAGAHAPAASAPEVPSRAARHGCCHAKKSAGTMSAAASHSSIRPNTVAGGAVSQCPFSNPATDPARKVRVEDAQAVSTVSPHSFAPVVKTVAPTPPVQPLAHDRGGTYLRCCVFLI